MITALLITAGVVVYSAVAGVVWHWDPLDLYFSSDKIAQATLWPVVLLWLGGLRLVTLPAKCSIRLLTRRAERKRLPQAKVVSK